MVPVLAQILGALLLIAGVAMLSPVAALIVAGLMLLAAGVMAENAAYFADTPKGRGVGSSNKATKW